MNNIPIKFQEHLKYLGITIDRKLNMEEHIRLKSCRAKRLMGASIGILQKYGQKQMIAKVWIQVIRPSVTYAHFMIEGKTKAGDRRLERLQLTAARASSNIYNNDERCLKKMNWQSMSELAQSQRLKMAYKYSRGLTRMPDDIFEIKKPNQSRTRRQLHDRQLFCRVSNNTESTRRAGFTQIATLWNSLPQDTVNLNKTSFKLKIRQH